MSFLRFVLLSFSVFYAAVPESVRAAQREQDREASARWLQRAESYAKTILEKDRGNLSETLSRLYVMSGDRRRAEALISGITKPSDRAIAQANLAFPLAKYEGVTAALAYARTLDERRTKDERTGEFVPSVQQSAIFHIFVVQVVNEDFVGAERTLQLIDDEVVKSRGWYRIAQFQASAGLCDAASKSAANIDLNRVEGREAKEAIQKLIAECKEKGQRSAPGKLPKDYLETLRQVAGEFGETAVPVDDLGKSENLASRLVGSERAASWREIAWAYHAEGKLAQCRRAIDESLKGDTSKYRPYDRILNYLSAADLYLELGEPDLARSLVKKADADASGQDFLKGIHSFTTAPLLVAVLVRLGNVQQAVTFLDKMPEDGTDGAAEALGVLCVKERKIDELERRLEGISSPRIKAVLSAGIAAGYWEPWRRADVSH